MDKPWMAHARNALAAAIAGDPQQAMAAQLEVIFCGEPLAVVGAAMMWIDALNAVVPPPAAFAEPTPEPGMSESQLWSLRLIAARVNDDESRTRQLFMDAAVRGNDYMGECLTMLLTLVGGRLGGRLGSQGFQTPA